MKRTLIILMTAALTAAVCPAKTPAPPAPAPRSHPIWINEVVDLPPALRDASAEVVIAKVVGNERGHATARLLQQGDTCRVFARVLIRGSGRYRISLKLRPVDGTAMVTLPLGERTFAPTRALDVVVVIDGSESMLENDPDNLRLSALKEFFALARHSRGVRRLALVVMHRRARVLLPLTVPSDIEDLQPYLDAMTPSGSTDFNHPFELAHKMLAGASAKGTGAAVLFMSDGRPMHRYRNRHRRLAALACPIYTIGLSDAADRTLLARIAKESGGRFFDAPQADQLRAHFIQIFQLIERPRTLSRDTVRVEADGRTELLIDPSMHNPFLHLAGMHGSVSARIGERRLGTLAAGDVRLENINDLKTGTHAVTWQGNGAISYELVGDSPIVLVPLPLNEHAATGEALAIHAYVEGAELADTLNVTCVVTGPLGRSIRIELKTDADYALYSGRLQDTDRPGTYRIHLRAEGVVDGKPFRRLVVLRYHRTGMADAVAPAHAPVQPDTPDAAPELSRDIAATADRALTRSEPYLTSTALSDPQWIDLNELVPGGTVRRTVTVLIQAHKDAAASTILNFAEPPRDVTFTVDGQVHLNRTSVLTITAVAGHDSAGAETSGDVHIRSEAGDWHIPIAGRVATPIIITQANAPKAVRGSRDIIARSTLLLFVEPVGDVTLHLDSDLPGLAIEPKTLVVGQDPVHVSLTLRPDAGDTIHRLAWRGTIRVSGAGLDSVSVPYEFSFPSIAAASVIPTDSISASIYWWWLYLVVMVGLLAYLIWAIKQGNRRTVFVTASVFVHLLLLTVVLPEAARQDLREAVTRLSLTGSVISEEQILSEFSNTSLSDLILTELPEDMPDAALVPVEPEPTVDARPIEPQSVKAETTAEEKISENVEIDRKPIETQSIAPDLESVERKKAETRDVDSEAERTNDSAIQTEPSKTKPLQHVPVAPDVVRQNSEISHQTEAPAPTKLTKPRMSVRRIENNPDAPRRHMQIRPQPSAAPRKGTTQTVAAPAPKPETETPKHTTKLPAETAPSQIEVTAENDIAGAPTVIEGPGKFLPKEFATEIRKAARKTQTAAVEHADPSDTERTVVESFVIEQEPEKQQHLAPPVMRRTIKATHTDKDAVVANFARPVVDMQTLISTPTQPQRRTTEAADKTAAPRRHAPKTAVTQQDETVAETTDATFEVKTAAASVQSDELASGNVGGNPDAVKRPESKPRHMLETIAISGPRKKDNTVRAGTGPAVLNQNVVAAQEAVVEAGAEATDTTFEVKTAAASVQSDELASGNVSGNPDAVKRPESKPRHMLETIAKSGPRKKDNTVRTGTGPAVLNQNVVAVHEAVVEAGADSTVASHQVDIDVGNVAEPIKERTPKLRLPSSDVANIRAPTPTKAARKSARPKSSSDQATPRSDDGAGQPAIAIAPDANTTVHATAIDPAALAAKQSHANTTDLTQNSQAMPDAVAKSAPKTLTDISSAPTPGSVSKKHQSPDAAATEPESRIDTATVLTATAPDESVTASLLDPELQTTVDTTAAAANILRATQAEPLPGPVAPTSTRTVSLHPAPAAAPKRAHQPTPSESLNVQPKRATVADPLSHSITDVQPAALEMDTAAPTPMIGTFDSTASDTRAPPAIQIEGGSAASASGSPWGNTFPLVKYSGDWDSDRTAMVHLAHQFEKRTGSIVPFDSRVVGLDDEELGRAPFVFISGHKNFSLSNAEAEHFGNYLKSGGYAWINDSTDIGDEVFDRAVRRELKRVLPGARLRKIPMNHVLFKAPYDLQKGYKGYAVPPGDKYRVDYLEGIWIGKRLTIVYTRNDYGDGLEIDPHTHPLMPSLSDLSPADMQESSIRMGINIVMHFLNKGKLPNVRVRNTVRENTKAPTDRLSAFKNMRKVPFALAKPDQSWQTPEGWEHLLETKVQQRKNRISIDYAKDGKGGVTRLEKVVITTAFASELDGSQVVLVDARSRLRGGARLALGILAVDGSYYESAPVYLKPGRNDAVAFDMRAGTFKGAASEWKYSLSLPANTDVTQWYFILYPQDPKGGVDLKNLRMLKE